MIIDNYGDNVCVRARVCVCVYLSNFLPWLIKRVWGANFLQHYHISSTMHIGQ
jgi:hypothetical protein